MTHPTRLAFADVTAANRSRAERWHPGFPADGADWTIADWSNAVCGEAGELANVIKKLRRHECGLRGEGDPTADDLRAMAAEEIADVILYADLLATKLGVDLPAAIVAKFDKVSERQGFPERLS
jgi:NTP pyrophosphatase (non-canonical NTP hydrolase)